MPRELVQKRVSPIWLSILVLAFLTVPVLLAFADTPRSSRADAAMARNTAAMETLAASKGLELGAPVYLRITKRPAELTAFLRDSNGRYKALKSWKICRFSGGLGPKTKEGDGKSPEGFYSVRPSQMNPVSSYHLSFNLGFPNAYDRAQGYTGSYLMVHGDCVSIGCYAMTDEGIEQIWTIMDSAFSEGQESIPVHIFPFPMPGGKVPEGYQGHAAAPFWKEIAPAWAAFESAAQPPQIDIRKGAYEIVSPVSP